MKIKNVEIEEVEFNLKTPSAVSYAKFEKVNNLIAIISTDNGITGLGCAAPDEYVTGEDIKKFNQYDKLDSILKGQDSLNFPEIISKIKENIPGFPSVYAMIEMALLDIVGKYKQKPVYELLDGKRKNIETSITIGLLPVEESIMMAKKFLAEGFNIFKIKLGGDYEKDTERVMKIVETVGKDKKIRLDPNQAYNYKDFIRFIQKCDRLNIEFVEQPFPKSNIGDTKKLLNRNIVKVMLDESVLSSNDAKKVVRRRCADYVNIKLMKCGGIIESVKIDTICKAVKISTMIGCMDESRISIAAALHFVLSSPNVKFVDLDGHIDIVDDVAENGFEIINGVMIPSDKYGLGVTLK